MHFDISQSYDELLNLLQEGICLLETYHKSIPTAERLAIMFSVNYVHTLSHT
jgi:hypothetical protein